MIMKHTIKNLFSLSFVALALLALCTACEDDTRNYDNKAFINGSKVGTILLMGTNDTENAIIQTAIAKPEATDILVTYRADSSLVARYNLTYEDEATLLPEEYYEISEPTSTIVAGTVKGNDVEVSFKNLSEMDREQVYVLPVTVASSGIEFLNSARTTYFVLKGAALINTVPDITENHLYLQTPGTSTLSNMSQVTVEALVWVNKFGKLISTLIGIEGKFLLRIGDAGIPDNQLQLAAANEGNVTNAAWQIPTNQWVHLAVTYDSTNGAVEVYMNGVKKGDTMTTRYRGTVNWANSEFYIGKSWDDNRWLEGNISECRVWKRILTADEIKAPNHYYAVAPDSEGLEAYWKFDEGVGQIVADHTGNGNTMVASKPITWKPVSLPK